MALAAATIPAGLSAKLKMEVNELRTKPNLLLVACACVLVPTMTMAEPITKQCLQNGHSGGWIADEIFIELDEDRDSARVADGIILNVEKKPKAAEITENNGKKLVVNWSVVLRSGGQTTNMAYRLAFFKRNQKVVVSAKPHGYVENFTARGRCQRTDQPLPTR